MIFVVLMLLVLRLVCWCMIFQPGGLTIGGAPLPPPTPPHPTPPLFQGMGWWGAYRASNSRVWSACPIWGHHWPNTCGDQSSAEGICTLQAKERET